MIRKVIPLLLATACLLRTIEAASLFTAPVNIYITPNAPMVTCTVGQISTGTDVIADAADASGYEVALLRYIALQAGWAASDWSLTCVSLTDLFTQVATNTSVAFGAGGIPITSKTMNDGYKFSLPVFNAGLQLVASTQSRENLWSFLSSFETWLWILILATTVVTGIVTFIFEEQSLSCRNRRVCRKNLNEMLWQAFSSLFFASDIRLQKFSARIMFLCFWFMVLVLSATYTADLTNQLASSVPVAQFVSLDQAAQRKLKIAYFDRYTELITGAQSGLVDPEVLAWGPGNLTKIFYDFGNQTIDGFVVDAPTANMFTSQYPCSTYSPTDYVVNFNYGFLFQGSTSYAKIQEVNLNLFTFKEGDDVQNYENKYINVAPLVNDCNQSVEGLDLHQLAGLWIILGGAVVISLVIHLISDIFIKGDKKLKLLMNRRKQTYTKEERKLILETYPMVTDFIHIPSKDLHQQVEKDIKDGLDNVENLIRERFLNAEKRVLMTLRKINSSINQNDSDSIGQDRSSFIFDDDLDELQPSEKFSTDRDSNNKEKAD